MTGFLIGTISDLCHTSSISICFLRAPHQKKVKKTIDWPALPITMVEVPSLSHPALGFYCTSFKLNRAIT